MIKEKKKIKIYISPLSYILTIVGHLCTCVITKCSRLVLKKDLSKFVPGAYDEEMRKLSRSGFIYFFPPFLLLSFSF